MGLLVLFPMLVYGQIVIHVDEPDVLQAYAGTDTLICKNHTVLLGGGQSGVGGSGEYFFNWYPSAGLDDQTSSNPECSPAETTTYMLTVTDSHGCTATSFVTVAVDPCLSVQLTNMTNEVSIYPNPVKEELFIDGIEPGLETTIKILNPMGQTVLERTIFSMSENGNRVVLNSKMEPGFYFVQIVSGKLNELKSIQIL